MGTLDFITAFANAEKIMPSKPFLVVRRETLSYGELLDRIRRLTTVFQQAGLAPGERVIVATTDDIEAVVIYFSLLRNGITTVMIDPRTPDPVAHTLFAVAQAKGIILDLDLRKSWDPDCDFVMTIDKVQGREATLFNKLLRKKSEVKTSADSYPAILKVVSAGTPSRKIDASSDALVLFTSGTTSHPKGVCLSYHNMASHLGTLSRQYCYDSSSHLLNVLPLHHTDGLTHGPLVAFWNGATVYRPMPFTIQNIGHLLDTVYAERITHFVAVPTIVALILKFGQEYKDAFMTADFRFIISSGAALEEELWCSFENYFNVRIANFYGLTETVAGGLFCGPAAVDHCYGTVGKPIDCQVRIVDDAGEDLGVGEAGELLIKGENVMRGYLNAPAATAAVLKDGWLYTGDIAECGEDGFYRIKGRKKNIIISGGLNVHPEEIVEALNTHDEVIESCTFGIVDDTWGEKIASAVVLADNSSLQENDLISFCRSRLAPAKIPHRIYPVPYLPKGSTGKIIIAKTRELAFQQESVTAEKDHGDVRNRILAIAARCFKAPQSDLDQTTSPETTPGWDSLAHLNFVVELETAFSFRFKPQQIMSLTSLQEAETLVLKQHNG
ncbi:MAG: AMP-binding protein [Planctomycetes bacterium]|nr:AMP-binding protein [Planctomycetota bacterium]